MTSELETNNFEGIVLRLYASGDSDVIVHLISPTVGKLALYAPRARGGHKGIPAIDVLDWGLFETKQGKGTLPALKAFHPRSSFHKIRDNFEKVVLASFLCEAFDNGMPDGEFSTEAFPLLWTALKEINDATTLKDSFRVTYQTFIKLMQENGILRSIQKPSTHALQNLANQLENYTGKRMVTKEHLPLAIDQLKKEIMTNSNDN